MGMQPDQGYSVSAETMQSVLMNQIHAQQEEILSLRALLQEMFAENTTLKENGSKPTS